MLRASGRSLASGTTVSTKASFTLKVPRLGRLLPAHHWPASDEESTQLLPIHSRRHSAPAAIDTSPAHSENGVPSMLNAAAFWLMWFMRCWMMPLPCT